MPQRCVITHTSNDTVSQLTEQFQQCAVEICGVSSKYNELLELILKIKPSIVLVDLDNKIEGGDIFGLRRELIELTETVPEFIALSSSKDLAYKALKNSFADYLLLPVSSSELCVALQKINKRAQNRQSVQRKICLRTYSDFRFLDADEIRFIQADNNGADFYLDNNTKVPSLKGLKYFEHELPSEFLRVHKSYIVNTNFISRIDFAKMRCTVSHIENQTIPISKTYRKDVLALKEAIFQRAFLAIA